MTKQLIMSDLFVESKCDDERIIMANILDVKTSSPDYVGYESHFPAPQHSDPSLVKIQNSLQKISEQESQTTRKSTRRLMSRRNTSHTSRSQTLVIKSSSIRYKTTSNLASSTI